MKAQRLRLTFARGEQAKDLSHLDTMRALEGAVHEAGLPLTYSQAKRPTPQISIAAPLFLGATSDCELADIYLDDRIAPARFAEALGSTLPAGMQPLAAHEVGVASPALQTQVRWADYAVDAPAGGRSASNTRQAIDELMSRSTLPWEHQREKKVLRYDLRPLVLDLKLEAECEGAHRLSMRLRLGQQRSGRPDQVVAALGLDPPLRIHRRRLYVDRTPAALRAFRRLGRMEE